MFEAAIAGAGRWVLSGLLLRRVQGLGIRTIAGDIVLDRSAFETVPQDPGAFARALGSFAG